MKLIKRKIKLDFNGTINRHWMANKAFESHWLNAYTLLIPDGEKFIIRSCKKYKHRASDNLQAEIQDLFYQEGQHSVYHLQSLDILTNQGYHFKGFINLTRLYCYKFLESISPNILALSTASAIEHLNAIIAEHYLIKEPFMEQANKKLARMFAWHFAEEIEHKSVVFDLLNEINTNSFIRFLGLLMAIVNFIGLLYAGSFYLAFQDKSLFSIKFWKDFWHFNFSNKFISKIFKQSGPYLRKSFHPTDIENTQLIDKGIDIYHELKGA